MSINIPNKDQWAKMNDHLNSIAVTLGSRVDTYTWVGIRNVVRSGLAPELFPIGTQFIVPHSEYGDLVFDVVAHDYFKSAKDANAPTMTLLCHDIIDTLQYDAREAFYYAENGLPAGTYHFTIPSSQLDPGDGTYQFTLAKAVPKGGQLVLWMSSNDVESYDSPTSQVIVNESAITLGNGGTNLGTLGVELNRWLLCDNGSNNYKESAIRQFLNSDAEAGNVWTPQTKFDRPPDWHMTRAGFMKGLSNDFLSIIGEVVVPCLDNATWRGEIGMVEGTKYTVNDKFYLVSKNEIFGVLYNKYDDGTMQFPYYNGATITDWYKYKNGVEGEWYFRTPQQDEEGMVLAAEEGGTNISPAKYASGIVPACTIV